MPPKRPAASDDENDDSIIDITGLFERLAVLNAAPPPPAPTPYIESYPGSGILIYNYDYAYREPASLGKTYGEKLGLTKRQISWLDKFYLPTNNTFLTIEPALQATLLLYLAVLPELDRRLKATGTTLAKAAKALEEEAKQISYQEGYWYHTHSRGGKVGTDIYLAIFRLCENALRQHYGYARRSSKLFPRQIARLEPEFHVLIGQSVAALLPALLLKVPPPSPDTERIFNEHTPQRWKTFFEPLAKLLPTKPAAFEKAVEKLARQNERNPAREAIYFEAAKLVARSDREAALRFYLHYLHDGNHWVHAQPKPLPKNLDKVLFPLPEHAQRFTKLVNLLKMNGDRKTVLKQVATVYAVERRKIELDPAAVQAARQQHAGTVELLNEYLRDDDAPEPSTSPILATSPAAPETTAATDAPAETAEIALLMPAADSAATGIFGASLGLSTTQQALLQLFAGQGLAVSQAAVETFAKAHGALRNQLIDGLNERCYDLLDDVLIEESGDDYTIYEAYYQQLTTSC